MYTYTDESEGTWTRVDRDESVKHPPVPYLTNTRMGSREEDANNSERSTTLTLLLILSRPMSVQLCTPDDLSSGGSTGIRDPGS